MYKSKIFYSSFDCRDLKFCRTFEDTTTSTTITMTEKARRWSVSIPSLKMPSAWIMKELNVKGVQQDISRARWSSDLRIYAILAGCGALQSCHVLQKVTKCLAFTSQDRALVLVVFTGNRRSIYAIMGWIESALQRFLVVRIVRKLLVNWTYSWVLYTIIM